MTGPRHSVHLSPLPKSMIAHGHGNVGRSWSVGTFIQGSGFCSSSPELEVWHDHHLAVAAKAAVKTTASATLQLSQLHLSISDVRHLPGDVDALLLEHWHVL